MRISKADEQCRDCVNAYQTQMEEAQVTVTFCLSGYGLEDKFFLAMQLRYIDVCCSPFAHCFPGTAGRDD